MFLLPTREKADAFNRVMTEQGCGAVSWHENTWHYYERWEHLLEGKTVTRSGYPFRSENGDVRCDYRAPALPKTGELLSRCLTIPVNIYMEEQIPRILSAINKAARVI